MPALLELQRALRRELLAPGDAALAQWLLDDGAERLSIYRHTADATLVGALRLSYPAVQHLVGADFFEAAAMQWLRSERPRGAYLNEFGAGWADFLAGFAPAAQLAYLADVARLEWAVNRALHASDAPPLSLQALIGLDAQSVARLRLTAHPGLSVLALRYPADLIWRAVLSRDERALAQVDASPACVWLLIERDAQGVQVQRVAHDGYEFTARLCAGERLEDALSVLPGDAQQATLAAHLSAGRFIAFDFTDHSTGGAHE